MFTPFNRHRSPITVIIMNRQLGSLITKLICGFGWPLSPGDVTQCMRIANLSIKMAHLTLLSSITGTQQRVKLDA